MRKEAAIIHSLLCIELIAIRLPKLIRLRDRLRGYYALISFNCLVFGAPSLATLAFSCDSSPGRLSPATIVPERTHRFSDQFSLLESFSILDTAHHGI